MKGGGSPSVHKNGDSVWASAGPPKASMIAASAAQM
jgi:hypothetical protein